MRTFILTRVTLQEMIHDKIFAVILVIAGLVIALSYLLGALSFSEQQKMLADFGFLAVELSCAVISIFVGSHMIAKEVEKQTCLLMLARPISRGQFIFAKFLGLVFVNFLITLLLGAVLIILMQIFNNPEKLLNISIILMSIFLKSIVLAGIAFVFSQLIRPAIALSFTFVVYLVGHWLEDMKYFAQKVKDENMIAASKFFEWIFPNFYKMNWKSWYFLDNKVASQDIMWMLAHTCGWILVMVFLMQVLFRRKDIV